MKKRTKFLPRDPFILRMFHQIPSLQKKIKELQKTNLVKDKEIKELREENERIKIILTVIAHDLRSPFNVLLGMTELLIEGEMPKEQETKCVRTMHKQTKHTFTLLTDLLNWSRIQVGGDCSTAANVNLKEAVNGTIKSLKNNAFKKGIKLTSEISPEIIVFTCPDIIRIIIRNLIANATKFTNANGKIVVEAINEGGVVKISVADTGIGIKQENLKKLFDPSFSTNGTNNEKGSGLGLMFCKDFIEKQGGTISVDSKLGEGTTFSFTVPGENPAAAPVILTEAVN